MLTVIKRVVATCLALLQFRVLVAYRGGPRSARSAGTIKIVCRYDVANGIANGALYQADTLRQLGYDVEIVDVSAAIKRPWRTVAASPGGVFIFHCGGPELPLAAWPLRRVLGTGRIIGYFAWESARPPLGWEVSVPLVDEVWTPSRFSAETLAQVYSVPIVVVPHVVKPRGTPRRWEPGSAPLTFLTMADSRSSLARKNPLGTIEAFRQAFPCEQNVRLIVKLKAHDTHDITRQIDALVRDDARITLLSDTLSRTEVDALFQSAHAFVSLHRAEGFGLPLLEAMGYGLATIATGWSGNVDFMSDKNSLLVQHRVHTTHDEGGVYGIITWADPDVSHAASLMRQLYEGPDFMASLIAKSWCDIRLESQLDRLRENLTCSDVLSPLKFAPLDLVHA